MKTKLSLILGGLLLLGQASAMAQVGMTVSATVPAASGLTLTVTTYNASNGAVIGSPSTTQTTLPFGTLVFNSATGTYGPTVFYGVSIASAGGAGNPLVNVTYAEGTGAACPNIAAGLSGTLGCLGTKTTAAFVTALPSTGAETPTPLGKKRLIDLNPAGTVGELPLSEIPANQYEKVYVGMWNGNSANTIPDPTNGLPFTNADAGGAYSGILTFTAVSG